MLVASCFRGPIGKLVASLTCLILVSGGATPVLAQTSASTIAGVILDPTGAPSQGFRVVFRDVESNSLYTSGPTDAAGNYAVQVPLGGRYKIENVVASDGVTKLPVQDVPPVSALTSETTHVNVRFTTAAESEPTGNHRQKRLKAAGPWYKRPGPIVGIVLGAGAAAALALSGGSDRNNSTPSPSQTTDR